MIKPKRSAIRGYQALVEYLSSTNFAFSNIPFANSLHGFFLNLTNATIAETDPEYIKYNNWDVYVDPTDHVGGKIYKFGESEPRVRATIESHVTDGDVALDIGGHIGHHAVTMRECVGERGRVLVFEPHPINADYIDKTIEQNDWSNVTLYRKAVSNKKRNHTLTENPDNTGNSSIKENDCSGYEVQGITLSEIFIIEEIEQVNLVKIDIEGAEIDVVRDMSTDILESIQVIIIEVHANYLSDKEMTEIYKTLNAEGNLTTISGNPVDSLQAYQERLREGDVSHQNFVWKHNQ